MSIAFSPGELIDIAIGIEIRGATFYDVMAKSTENELARTVFSNLARMEHEHIRIFRDMLETGRKYPPPEEITGEDADYLRALVDSAVFTDDLITGEMATEADSDMKAVELGIEAEKDSILFYSQMKGAMPRQAAPVLEKIIAEERLHLRQLAAIKKELAGA